jgi:transposase
VSEVKIVDGEKRYFEVRVECAEKTSWTDPETKERAHIHDWRERRWRHLDTLEYETWVVAKIPRVKLSDGKLMTVSVPWAEPGGRLTLSMENRIIDLVFCCRTATGAAKAGHVTRAVAEGVMQRAVTRGLRRREFAPLKSVGIDEKAIRRGHRYATILTDLETGTVIDVVEGRDAQSARRLFARLPEALRKSIEVVAMDMWPAYIRAAGECLPEALHVFDRFHIMKHLNEALDKVRRREHRDLSAAGDDTLKGTKYKWLRRYDDLRLACAVEFRRLLNHNLNTGRAWSLRELFRRFWSYRSLTWAWRFFDNWIACVRASEIKPLMRVAGMFERHAEGILNYILCRVTNAASESVNATIQSIKTAARGLPDFLSFRARILFFKGNLELYAR